MDGACGIGRDDVRLTLLSWSDGSGLSTSIPLWATPLALAAGVLLLFVSLHLVRGIGRVHGLVAKHLLVRTAQYS